MKKKDHFLYILILAILATTCNRMEELTFSDFDENNDQVITEAEFKAVFEDNYYDDWNKTNNLYLDDEDFMAIVYNVWDADDDALINENEWLISYQYHFGDYVVTDFNGIDTDGDGFVEYSEYYELFNNTDMFSQWDQNASDFLEEEELGEAVFEAWDLNNNQKMEKSEFIEFDKYFLDI